MPDRSRVWAAWKIGAVTLLANALLIWYFHDRYWYPSDDGFYAHIAARLLRGESLHRDVQDIHPGLIHLLHAQAMRLFGMDVLSLRYPLVVVCCLQSVAVFALLRHVDVTLAALTSVACTALGVLQFIDPTPNWYALALVCVTAWWLTGRRRPDWLRWFVAGCLVGVIVALRHLSGVWAGMALVTLALREQQQPTAEDLRWQDTLVARAVFGVMFVATCWYLLSTGQTGDVGGLLLIATAPTAVLIHGVLHTRTPNGATLRVCAWLAVGVAVALLPLGALLAREGALGAALENTIGAALDETAMPFFRSAWYGALPIAAAYQVLTSSSLPLTINGVYWCVLPLLFAANGVLLVRDLRTQATGRAATLSVVAAFFGMVALFFHGPLYLYYGVGPVLVALVARLPRRRYARAAAAAGVTFLGATALFFHAGQPRERTALDLLQGRRFPRPAADAVMRLPGATLRVSHDDVEQYSRTIASIDRWSRPSDPIWVLPNDAQLYFLAGRRNPFRFYNTAFGLRHRVDVEPLVRQLECDPPPLVVYRPGDKYETETLAQLMEHVRRVMRLAERQGPFELYVPRRH